VEYAYAKKNNIPVMALQNKDGKFVMPDDDTFAAAAAGADWFSVPGMGLSIVNQPGANAYPVTTASFILMYKEPANKAESAEVLKFFDWAFKNGKQMALDLDYVPLPDKLTNQIRSASGRRSTPSDPPGVWAAGRPHRSIAPAGCLFVPSSSLIRDPRMP
jgi:phosphate transport system substrate-binding protein